MVNSPLVSVVIPIVPSDPHIEECLRHVHASTYKNIEVIVVNERKERSYQRNFGIKKANGKYLLWLDSDMMITPGLIEECVSMMEGNEAEWKLNGTGGFLVSQKLSHLFQPFIGIYIPEHIVTKGWFGRLRNWERQFYTATLVDVMRFVRLPCPLFDETLHGVEDSSWERQFPPGPKGITVNHFDHHDRVSLLKYLRKKAYYAKCLSQYKQKNPNDKLLTFKYRCWDVFTANGKWKKFFARPDLALQVFILLFARGIIAMVQEARYK